MKKTTGLLVSLCAMLALVAGCGQGVDNTDTPAHAEAQTTKAKAPATKDADASSKKKSDKGDSSDSLTKKFGSTFTWDDGSSITVSKPKAYKPSKWAAIPKKFPHYVIMTVTLKNGTSDPVDAMMWSLSATTGDAQSEQVFDENTELPTAKILPGKTLKYKVAFGVKKGKDFVVVVQYGFGNADGIYKQ